MNLPAVIDEILDSAHNFLESRSIVVPKLIRTAANKLSTLVDINVKNAATGDLERKQCNVKLFEYFDGITLCDFVRGKKSNVNILSETYYEFGRLSGHLFEFLHTQNHLVDQLRRVRQGFSWQLDTCESFLRDQLELLSSSGAGDDDNLLDQLKLIEQALEEYVSIKSRLDAMPKFVVHGDLGTRNVLMDKKSGKPTCLIDFGDIQVGNQLTDLAVAMLYGVLEQEGDFIQALEKIPAHILRGYRSVVGSRLEDEDLDMALTLMKLRLCQSLANAQVASKRDPGNSCAVTTLKNGWLLLEILIRHPKYNDPAGMARLWRELC